MYLALGFPTKGLKKIFKCKKHKRNTAVDMCDVSQSTIQAEVERRKRNADADPCRQLLWQYCSITYTYLQNHHR